MCVCVCVCVYVRVCVKEREREICVCVYVCVCLNFDRSRWCNFIGIATTLHSVRDVSQGNGNHIICTNVTS